MDMDWKKGVISFAKPKSVESEAFRALRTNLEFSMTGENQKVILVTSSRVGEGKSTVASNLGSVFAMQNKKTLIIDTDMRRGTQHKHFNLPNTNGLSNYLSNVNFNPKEFLKRSGIDNLEVVTSGAVPPNPSELLSLDTMTELIEGLKTGYDVIILDGAPVLPVTDSVVLANKVDKILVVTSCGETNKAELVATKKAIESVGAKVTGVVLNKVNTREKYYSKYANKYYSGYYSYDSETSDEFKFVKKSREKDNRKAIAKKGATGKVFGAVTEKPEAVEKKERSVSATKRVEFPSSILNNLDITSEDFVNKD